MKTWDRIPVSGLLPLLYTAVLLASNVGVVDGRVILCDQTLGKEVVSTYEDKYPFYGKIFSSVAFFDFRELRILYEVDFVMNGLLKLYNSKFLPSIDGPEEVMPVFNPEEAESLYHPFPKLMLADLETESFDQIDAAARNVGVDFVILTLDDTNYTWQEKFKWWWLRELPKVPAHKYFATANSLPPYYLAMSSLDGSYLTEILLKKESAILDYGDINSPEIAIQIDDSSMVKGIDLVVQATLYLVFVFLALRWLIKSDIMEETFQQQEAKPKFTAEDLGEGIICEGPCAHECAICLEAMPPGTKVRILPCRHSFHEDCIVGWLNEGKTTCPLCKFDLLQHFEEQKEARESILPPKTFRQRFLRRFNALLRFRGRTIQTDDDQLLTAEIGDLELTEEIAPASSTAGTISVANGVTV
ncbi:unnamed protein product [Cylindrotheca closterium]|uniref:RING-type domain-containing protein n=1 Tax=Cylindrotheca closterium TaxID=2856 RepID=A0AAD2CKE4_9STRA|nr:unnamed protein product [Cylindrotheca closterium]